MPKQPLPFNVFAERVRTLRADPRFNRLFGIEETHRVTLALWLLDLDGPGGARTARLLWGWIVQASEDGEVWWTKHQEKNWSTRNQDQIRFRHGRLSLTATPASVEQLLTLLGDGHELGPAAAMAGLPAPPAFASLSLGTSTEEVAKQLVLGPVRLLAAGEENAMLATKHRSLSSPSNHSVLCAAVCRLRKPALWHKLERAEPLDGGDDIVRHSLAYLEQETGLAFRGADARRVGDIEWISAPMTDINENNYVDVILDRDRDVARTLSVAVRPGPLAIGTPLLVRCRLSDRWDVLVDECFTIGVGDPPRQLVAPANLSRILVTIWTPADSSIWYEKSSFLVRQVALAMGSEGLRGRLSTDWSRAVTEAYSKAKQRIEHLNEISQVHYTLSAIGTDSALESAEQDMASFASELFTVPSGAEFFEKGWFASGGIEFITWFRQQTDRTDVRAFVLLDPYFDDVGLTEFFSRARNTAVEYIAITNSQVASLDDTRPDGTKSSRRERLREAFSSLEPILGSLRISVFDVNRASSGAPSTTQVFHDRYLILYGDKGKPLRGFHLSNSIQGATKKAPLLVTPIPSDVLPRVARYVAALKDGDSTHTSVGEKLTVETIVASQERQTRRWRTRLPTVGLDFFAELLGNASHTTLTWHASEDVVRARAFDLFEKSGREHGFHLDDWLAADSALTLQRAGLLTKNGAFVITAEIVATLPRFVDQLATDTDTFTRWWRTFCRWRQRIATGDELIVAALDRRSAELLPRWYEFLISQTQHPAPRGTSDTPPTQETLLAVNTVLSDFNDGLRVGQFFETYRRFYGSEPSIQSTLEDIAVTNASALVDLAEALVAALPAEAHEAINTPGCAALAPVFAPLLATLAERICEDDNALIDRMLRSSLPSFRAIAGRSVLRQHQAATDVARHLLPLSPRERLDVLIERVSDLRADANRNRGHGTAVIASQLDDIFPIVVAHWPGDMTTEEMVRAALRLGGPGSGAWAPSTLERVFTPLVAAGTLSWADVAKTWGDTLLDKLAKLAGAFEHQTPSRDTANSESRMPSYGFYLGDDSPLSEALARSLVLLDETERQKWAKKLTGFSKPAGAMLHRPFIRSQRYSAWAAARDILDWLSGLAGLVVLHGEQLPALERDTWRAAHEQYRAIIESVPPGHNEDLRKFSASVSAALAEYRDLDPR